MRHGDPARVRHGDPARVRHGDPARVRHGDPARVRHGDSARVRHGDPARVRHGDPADLWHDGPSMARPIDPSRFVTQTTFGDYGNCLAASLASVLGMRLQEMPNLRGPDWYEKMRQFLAPRGLRPVVVARRDVPDGSRVLNIGLGDGPRGRPHAVVCSGVTVVHDPHPDRRGLLKVPDHHVFVV